MFQRLNLLPYTHVSAQLPLYELYVHMCPHLYSPGMNAESDMDDKVIEYCTDADVFVYVANGIATFETTVSQTLCL